MTEKDEKSKNEICDAITTIENIIKSKNDLKSQRSKQLELFNQKSVIEEINEFINQEQTEDDCDENTEDDI